MSQQLPEMRVKVHVYTTSQEFCQFDKKKLELPSKRILTIPYLSHIKCLSCANSNIKLLKS